MPLEGGDHVARGFIKRSGHRNAVAKFGQSDLQPAHLVAFLAERKLRHLSVMREGVTHSPTPESASSRQGNFSPGSRLRKGATSECASTRRA